jgi:hypothetical protein
MPGSEEFLHIPKLDGKNYLLWKFQIRVILESHDLLGVVEGTEVKPQDARQLPAWLKKDAKARMFISTTMSHEQLQNVVTCASASAMWSRLLAIYERKSDACKMAVQQRFFAYKMGASDLMAAHIAKVEALAMELATLGEEVSETMQMAKLLGALPSKYSHLVTAWESVDSAKRTKAELISRLLQEEQRLAERDDSTNEQSAFATQIRKTTDGSNGERNTFQRKKCHLPLLW